jgi:hypothetical protein
VQEGESDPAATELPQTVVSFQERCLKAASKQQQVTGRRGCPVGANASNFNANHSLATQEDNANNHSTHAFPPGSHLRPDHQLALARQRKCQQAPSLEMGSGRVVGAPPTFSHLMTRPSGPFSASARPSSRQAQTGALFVSLVIELQISVS